MSHTTWMIYGATGTTGTLIAETALRRGHQPVLAGRSAASLAALGKRLGLPWKAVGLDEPDQLQWAVSEVDAMLNAAGPFIATAPPLVAACLAAGTHYLDIAGEIPVLQHLFARDQAARERNIALIGGVGFGVVASNSTVAPRPFARAPWAGSPTRRSGLCLPAARVPFRLSAVFVQRGDAWKLAQAHFSIGVPNETLS